MGYSPLDGPAPSDSGPTKGIMSDLTAAAAAPPPAMSRLGRLRSLDPAFWVGAGLLALLAFLVVHPLVRLVLASLTDAESGGLTLANYAAAYGRARHLQALWNSVQLGLWVALLATAVALPLAWLLTRTDVPGRRTLRVLVLSAFIIPPYLGAIAWILLAGPNAGWLNRLYVALTGAEAGPFNVYSLAGMVVVIASTSFAYPYILVSSALELIPSDMEEAAAILGAGPGRTLVRVTLPLALPAILGGVILSFLEAIALFGVPALLAIPARMPLLTTQLWQFFGTPVRVEVAAAYAMPLLLVTVALIWLQRRVLARKGYAAVGGKGGARRPVALGRWRWPAFAYAFGAIALAVFLPLAVLLQAAFAKAWGRGLGLDNFTFENLRFLLFDHNAAPGAIVHSLLYAAGAAAVAVSVALCVAYVVQRRLVPCARVLAFLCLAPFVIPGIVLAIGFFAAYTAPPLPLYGTAFILIFAFAARFLPIAYTGSNAALLSLHPELEEAVRILGGGRLTAIRRVLAPLLKRSLLGGSVLVFILATHELSAAIFLYTTNTRVLSVLLFDLSEEGNFERLASLGLILLVLTLALVAVGYKLAGRDFLVRREAGAPGA